MQRLDTCIKWTVLEVTLREEDNKHLENNTREKEPPGTVSRKYIELF